MTLPVTLASMLPGRSGLPGVARAAALPGGLFADLLDMQVGSLTAGAPAPDGRPARKPAGDLLDAASLQADTQAVPMLAVLPQAVQLQALPQPGLSTERSADEGAAAAETLLELTRQLEHGAGQGGKKLPQQAAAEQQILPAGAASVAVAGARGEHSGAPVSLSIATPLGRDEAWQRAFATQVGGLVQMKAESAQIQVSPANLGPIEVSLKLGQDQAQLTFVTATPQARDAVEQGLARLSGMLAQSGIQLTDAQVSYGDRRQQQDQAPGKGRGRGEGGDFAVAELDAAVQSAHAIASGLSIRA